MRKLVTVGILVGALAAAQEFRVGGKVPEFSLQNVKGAPVAIATVGSPATVILFIATQCPVSNRYNQRMTDLYNDYASKGVRFVFVNPNHTEPAGEVEKHAKENSFPFAVYKDADNVIADRFGAQFTPEVFVLDGAGVISYHGRIDDAQNLEKVQHKSLRLALDAMLAGKPVEPAETKAFGCTIKRVRKAS